MSNKTILVIEDELPLQKAIDKKLERSGFGVLTSREVGHAMDLINDNDINVDAIWLDHYLLGKKNGLDFVAGIKNDEQLKKIPIFVVSNTASHDKVSTYLQLGVEKYYTKSDNRLDVIIEEITKTIKNK